jgi:hypothetical protein
VKSVDLVAGGPPCQPFSRAGSAKIRDLVAQGKRKPNDERAELWRSFVKIVETLKPKVVPTGERSRLGAVERRRGSPRRHASSPRTRFRAVYPCARRVPARSASASCPALRGCHTTKAVLVAFGKKDAPDAERFNRRLASGRGRPDRGAHSALRGIRVAPDGVSGDPPRDT